MKLASVECIRDIRPHSGADRLELAQVIGWQCVVRKGEFRTGDRIVFVTIDTLLPPAEWSRFLSGAGREDRPVRLKTARLRGEYSQGLILPIAVLPESARALPEGSDVGGLLGILKYEKEIPAGLAGLALGPFPSHICTSTDEENGLSNDELVASVLGGPVTVTRKLDGSSCTIVVEDGAPTHVCSRRLRLKESEDSGFWRAARKIRSEALGEGVYVIQGELMGPGVQGNQLRLKDGEIRVFQVRKDGFFLSYQEMDRLCQTKLGCQAVPLVAHFDEAPDLGLLQTLADSQTLPTGEAAEGIVIRPRDYRSGGDGRPLGFKLINRNYRD